MVEGMERTFTIKPYHLAIPSSVFDSFFCNRSTNHMADYRYPQDELNIR